ncbi:MAG: DUF2232 domain-containing protein [Gemmatimonadetes bacterium]|nr:DUF2232 domain-containing protein [Gemmatimonadota bacterium]
MGEEPARRPWLRAPGNDRTADVSQRGGSAAWGTVAVLTVVAATLSAVNPGLLLIVPFALLVLALPPRRPVLMIAAVVLAALLMTGVRSGTGWYFERGWALLAAGWFVLAVALLPGVGFIVRGLVAVTGAAVTSVPFLWLNRGAFSQLETALGGRLRDAAAQAAAVWQNLSNRAASGSAANGSAGIVDTVNRAADLQVLLFPALLALATLAALAVAWWAYRRWSLQDREPLRPFREFAFPNDLVWLLIVGIALIVVPASDAVDRAGANVLTFMVALYALRGAAVLLVIGGAPGPLGMFMGLLALLFLYPLVMAATVLVGLTDTWIDIRAKRASSEPR